MLEILGIEAYLVIPAEKHVQKCLEHIEVKHVVIFCELSVCVCTVYGLGWAGLRLCYT